MSDESNEPDQQPPHKVTGLLTSLYEEWARVVPDDEWGAYIVALSQLASAAMYTDLRVAVAAIGWMKDEIDRAFAEDWWGDQDELSESIEKAQAKYSQIIAYGRSIDKDGEIEEVIASLPDWLQPAQGTLDIDS